MPNSKATVSGDFSNLISGAENAAKSIANLGLKLSGISGAGKAFDAVTGAIGGTVNALGKIGLAASGIEAMGKSAAAMGMGLLQGNAALEMTTISFKTLLGSASAASDMIKQLTVFAQTTPFELTGLEASTQKLLAFGFQAKDIIPLMTSMGDAISALGGTQDNLNSLVYVMGQMHSEAHINAGDIMQMTNLGIPALQMLADHYHKTTGEIQEMISKGLIPGNEAVQIFSDSLEKKYGGMMAAQSATFSGMLSNLQDWFTATSIILTKPLFEPAKKALQAFLNFVQSPAGVAIINNMALEIQKAVDAATKAFIRFEPQIRPTLTRLLEIANAIRVQMTPGILSLIPLLFQFWQRIEPVALALFKFYQAIQPLNIALAGLRGLITGGLPGALAALQGHFAMISGYVKIALNAALLEFQRFGPAVLTWVVNTAVVVANRAVVLGEALIHWVAPYAGRLIGELINLAGRVLTWIVGYAPVIANQVLVWAEAIASWVIPAIPKVLTALLQLALGVVAWIEREAPVLTSMFLTWASSALSWILPAIPGILATLAQLGLAILTWVEREAPVLLSAFLGWTEILASWIIPAIPGVIRSLEQLGATIVNWAINRLPVLLGQILVGIGKGFGVNLSPAVNDVLKIFYSLVDNIQSTVIPAFDHMVKFLAGNLMPLLDRLTNFTTRTIIPTLASLAAFVMGTVVPVFVRIADIVGRVFGPSLTLIGSIIRNELLPALSDSWSYFDGKYMPTVRDMASAFGDKLAGGIQSAVDKFKDALPGLEDFFKKIEPIIGKALELYQALSPISIALDVLKGLLTGGLQGGLNAFEKHISDAGKAFGIDLKPAIDWFNNTIVKQVIPTVQSMANTFLTDWWPKIQTAVGFVLKTIGDLANSFVTDWWPKIRDAVGWVIDKVKDFSDFVTNQVWPPVSAFLGWLGDQGVKLWNSVSDTLTTTVIPAVQKFLHWVADELWPKLRDEVFPWIDKNVRPKLEDAFKIIDEKIIPFMGNMVDTILNHIIPALVAWWGVLFTLVNPFLSTIGDTINKIVLPALDGLFGSAKDNKKGIDGIIDGFKHFLGFVEAIAGGFHRIWEAMGGWQVETAIGNIARIVKIVGLLADTIDALTKNDYRRAISDMLQVKDIWSGTNTVISGGGSDPSQYGGYYSSDPAVAAYQKYMYETYGIKPGTNAPQKASGDSNWRGGLVEIGERGMELIRLANNRMMLATGPMLANLPRGTQIFNNRDTMAMLPSPASAQQISNMYSTSNANRSWDYSTQNSHNVSTTNQYFYGQQQGGQMPFGQQMRWYGAK